MYKIEEIKDLKFELLPNSQVYVLKNFDEVKKAFNNAICDLHVNEVLTDDISFRDYKKRRTSINTAKKKIARVRLDLTECVMGTFQEQCKELERMLDEASKLMTENIKSYEHKEKTSSFKLTITSGSKEQLEKIKNYASQFTNLTIEANYDTQGE